MNQLNAVSLNSWTKPPLQPPLPNLYLDRVEFRASVLARDGSPYSRIALPHILAATFEVAEVNVTKTGFVTSPSRRGYFGTNGTLLVRIHQGKAVSLDDALRNQFNDDELQGTAGSYTSEHQIKLFLSAQDGLYSFLASKLNGATSVRLPLHFTYAEFYVELNLPAHREDFFRRCSEVVVRAYGSPSKDAKNLRYVNEQETIRSRLEQYWEIDHAIKKRRAEKVRLKIYEKGSRIRIEVSFRNFHTQSNARNDPEWWKDPAVYESECLLNRLWVTSQEIIAPIALGLSDLPLQRINAETLRQKLKEYKVRSVKGPSYSHLIQALDHLGVYDPLKFPKDERPKKETLKRLSSPEDGFLVRKPILNKAGYPKRNFYLLRKDWEEIHPEPKC